MTTMTQPQLRRRLTLMTNEEIQEEMRWLQELIDSEEDEKRCQDYREQLLTDRLELAKRNMRPGD